MKKIVKKEEINRLLGMSAYERGRCKMDFYSRQARGGGVAGLGVPRAFPASRFRL